MLLLRISTQVTKCAPPPRSPSSVQDAAPSLKQPCLKVSRCHASRDGAGPPEPGWLSHGHLGSRGQSIQTFGLHTPTAHELVSLKGLGFTDGWTPSLKINIDTQIGLLWGKIFVLFIFLSLPRIEGLVAHFCLPQVDIILLLVNLMMY